VAEPDYRVIPHEKPLIESVHLDDHRRLWIRLASNDTARTQFDVWDSHGKRIATVLIPHVVLYRRPFVVRGDSLFFVVGDNNAQFVVRAVTSAPLNLTASVSKPARPAETNSARRD
jgi:hypothetical protein